MSCWDIRPISNANVDLIAAWLELGGLQRSLTKKINKRKSFPKSMSVARVEITLSDDTKHGEVEEYLLGELFKRNWTIFVSQRCQTLKLSFIGVTKHRNKFMLVAYVTCKPLPFERIGS